MNWRVLPCGHRFHAACVDEWLFRPTGACPTCRKDPTTGVDVDALENRAADEGELVTVPGGRGDVGGTWATAWRSASWRQLPGAVRDEEEGDGEGEEGEEWREMLERGREQGAGEGVRRSRWRLMSVGDGGRVHGGGGQEGRGWEPGDRGPDSDAEEPGEATRHVSDADGDTAAGRVEAVPAHRPGSSENEREDEEEEEEEEEERQEGGSIWRELDWLSPEYVGGFSESEEGARSYMSSPTYIPTSIVRPEAATLEGEEADGVVQRVQRGPFRVRSF